MEELCANKSKQMKKVGCKLKKMKNKMDTTTYYYL